MVYPCILVMRGDADAEVGATTESNVLHEVVVGVNYIMESICMNALAGDEGETTPANTLTLTEHRGDVHCVVL